MITDTTTIAPANIPSRVPQNGAAAYFNSAAATTPAALANTVGTIMGSQSNAHTTTAATQATTAAASHLLHRQFVQLGRERNRITYKLLALLPQIYKQKIYASEGYGTIYEYAGKLAGLSHSIVEKALKLENKLQNKPHLQRAIETQGIHKVAIVARLATPENEQMFADKVENMSKPALQQWSKELRGKIIEKNCGQLFECNEGLKNKREVAMKIEMDDEMEFLFLKIKNKMGKNLSNKEILKKILVQINETIAEKWEIKSSHRNMQPLSQAKKHQKIPGEKLDKESENTAKYSLKNNHKTDTRTQTNRVTRYIRITIKRAAIRIANGKCAHEGCNKPYEILHHVIRFAGGGGHESIIPLCKEHHEFAHNGLLKEDTLNEKSAIIDEKYRKCRRQVLMI